MLRLPAVYSKFGAMAPSRHTTMPKTLRIIAGIVPIGLLLTAAWLATRSCTADLFVYDSCLWIWVREQLGLPGNKFLRAVFLELVGLAILAGLYLTVHCVFPRRVKRATPPELRG
ncbi:MAG: hypothetical protein LAP13_11450 [Acidobacteriia bacterium]|nr:hypothetical protein [Terriglobia bacterium]